MEPRWDVVFLLRLDELAPTCWQSLGGLKERVPPAGEDGSETWRL